MFTLDPLHPLYTAILDAVAGTPHISLAELHATLRRRRVDITLQHLYRTVNRMVEEQILLKSGTTVSVNLMWLSYLEFFAGRAKTTILQDRSQQVFPLKDGERRMFKVHCLLDLQTIWNHLLVELYRSEPQKYLFKYYSHAWWQLGKHSLDPAFYKRITELGVRCYWVFGNTTFLDHHAADLHKDLMDVRLVEKPPFPSEGYCLNVYGPYVFECLFPEKITKHFDFIFHNVTAFEQFDPEIFSDIFLLKVPLTLKVSRSEKQAAPLRATIGQYFLKPTA